MKKWILVLITMTVVHTPNAYDVLGAGGTSCGGWLENRKSNSGWHSTSQWVMGFLAGVQEMDEYKLARTDHDAIASYLDKYCEENPLDPIVKASQKLGAKLILMADDFE